MDVHFAEFWCAIACRNARPRSARGEARAGLRVRQRLQLGLLRLLPVLQRLLQLQLRLQLRLAR